MSLQLWKGWESGETGQLAIAPARASVLALSAAIASAAAINPAEPSRILLRSAFTFVSLSRPQFGVLATPRSALSLQPNPVRIPHARDSQVSEHTGTGAEVRTRKRRLAAVQKRVFAAEPDTASSNWILATRELRRRQPHARDRTFQVVVGVGFVVAATAAALAINSQQPIRVGLLVLLVLTYALAAQVEFEIGPGSAVPTELAFVPMLFLLPLWFVPVAVAAGLLLADAPHYLRGDAHPARAIGALANSWYCLGPVVVLAAFAAESPRWSDWPVYVLALAVQFAVDFAVSIGRGWFVFGVPPRNQLPEMLSVWVVDVGLAPLALTVVIAGGATAHAYAFLVVVPLVLLLGVFARERRERIESSVELGRAYRGTALLLGDLVEADDKGTGLHSRDVVSLVTAVVDRLGLDEAARRDAEFAALLHDVGKIRIPKEIINKPGPLDGEEWGIVKQHTIWGEEMLASVGGILGGVGAIVRSCHECYDGNGYPDRLAGEEIPIIARIILACDAYSAITTDRSYRAARSPEVGIEELLAHRGTQFDPAVVDALVAAVDAG